VASGWVLLCCVDDVVNLLLELPVSELSRRRSV